MNFVSSIKVLYKKLFQREKNAFHCEHQMAKEGSDFNSNDNFENAWLPDRFVLNVTGQIDG